MRRRILGKKICSHVQSPENLIGMRLVSGDVISSEKQGSAIVLQLAVFGMTARILAELRNSSRSRSRGLIHLNVAQIPQSSLRFGSQFRSMHENSAGFLITSCKVLHHAQRELYSPGFRPELLGLLENHPSGIEAFVPDEFHSER